MINNDSPCVPLVSAVIPAYNVSSYVGRAIRSVLAQTYPNIECIVVDDGSTDDTFEVIASFGDKVRCIKQHNRGASAARNTGVAVAKGEFIAFLDSDDYWLPSKTFNQVAAFQLYPDAVLCHTNFQHHSETLQHEDPVPFDTAAVRLERRFRNIFADPYLGTPTVMVRASRLREINGFDTSLPIAEDIDMFLRCCEGHSFIHLMQTQLVIESRSDSLGSNPDAFRCNLEVIDRLLARMPTFFNEERTLVGQKRHDIYESWVAYLRFSGRGSEARRVLAESRATVSLSSYRRHWLMSFLAPVIAPCRRLITYLLLTVPRN